MSEFPISAAHREESAAFEGVTLYRKLTRCVLHQIKAENVTILKT